MPDDSNAEDPRMARMLKKSFFVMFRNVLDPSRIGAAMHAHHDWIIGLEKEGGIFASGPMFGEEGQPAGGMTVLRATDHAEASKIAAGDPFMTSGAMTFEIRRWQVNEGRVVVSVDFSDRTYRFD